MFKNMRVGAKLGLAIGLVVMLLIATGLFSLNRIAHVGDLLEKFYRSPFAVTNAVARVDGEVVRMHRSMKDVALSKTPADLDKAVAAVDASEKKAYDRIKIIKERFLGDKSLIERLEKGLDDWRPTRQRVIALMREKLAGSVYAKRAERWATLPALTNEADNMCISCHEPGRLKPTAARLGITLSE